MNTAKNMVFTQSSLDGEIFYTSAQAPVNHNSLLKAAQVMGYSKSQIQVFDPRNGVFSVYVQESA